MPVANVDYLYSLGQEILTNAVAALAANGIAAPARRYVSPGEIADDCEQMVVQLSRVYSGFPGGEILAPEKCGFVRTGEFLLRLIRCVLDTEDQLPPTDAELDARGRTLLQDVWVLHQGLIERYGSGAFLARCQDLALGGASPVGPEGGLGGWQFVLQIQLEEP